MSGADDAGQVTLVLRSIEKRWRDEFLLNLLAAAATGSQFSHCELAIGDEAGNGQEMRNVLRIYNDKTGVELCQRTGKSPNYRYLQIGCSKQAEQRMLRFAHAQKSKPFDMPAMLRSVVYPRATNFKSYFCAELVAACLREGGLMHHESNPGSATPQSLYNLYSPIAAVSGNPMTMRLLSQSQPSLQSNAAAYPPHCDLELGARPVQSAYPARALSVGACARSAASATYDKCKRHQQQLQQQQLKRMAAMAPWVMNGGAPGVPLIAEGAPPPHGNAAAGPKCNGSRAEMGIRNAVRNAFLKQKQVHAYQQQRERLGLP